MFSVSRPIELFVWTCWVTSLEPEEHEAVAAGLMQMQPAGRWQSPAMPVATPPDSSPRGPVGGRQAPNTRGRDRGDYLSSSTSGCTPAISSMTSRTATLSYARMESAPSLRGAPGGPRPNCARLHNWGAWQVRTASTLDIAHPPFEMQTKDLPSVLGSWRHSPGSVSGGVSLRVAITLTTRLRIL